MGHWKEKIADNLEKVKSEKEAKGVALKKAEAEMKL